MGVDKARLRLGAGTVLERVIGAATPMGLPLSLVCASSSEEADERTNWLQSFDLPITPDLQPDLGPLGGLHTALSSSSADRLLRYIEHDCVGTALVEERHHDRCRVR